MVRSARAVRSVTVRAAAAETTYETYEVELEKPLQVKFGRGNDGGAYVTSVGNAPGYEEFEIGDKISKVSASFGADVWAAENYGQVMYAVKTRTGSVYLQLQKRGGDMSVFEEAKADSFKNERNAGNYGDGTKELQAKNYAKAKELASARVDMFNEALGLYKKKNYDEALVVFENVVGLEPKNYIGDNMQKVTDVYRIAQYNVACCYSMINQTDAAVDALKAALISGFDDYKMIRGDASLETVRKDPRFKQLIDRFDEPLLNENAMKVLKGMFGRK